MDYANLLLPDPDHLKTTPQLMEFSTKNVLSVDHLLDHRCTMFYLILVGSVVKSSMVIIYLYDIKLDSAFD